MPHGLTIRGAPPLKIIGEPAGVTKEDIDHENGGDNDERQAQRPVNRDQQNHEADAGENQIFPGRKTRTIGNGGVIDDDVKARRDDAQAQEPVVPGYRLTRAPLQQRESHGGQETGEGQMDQPRG
jgi:hypothetical protein